MTSPGSGLTVRPRLSGPCSFHTHTRCRLPAPSRPKKETAPNRAFSTMESIRIEAAAKKKWDAIVVGTGMGGGTAGFALARAGLRVLFIEKGLSHLNPANVPVQDFPESNSAWIHGDYRAQHNLLKNAGRATEEVIDRTLRSKNSFIPNIGSGLGGSSSLYGAALERFFPEDFSVTPYFKGAIDSSVVDWPISYFDLEKYYTEAESLYSVHGSSDPLRLSYQNTTLPHIDHTPAGREWVDKLRHKGLHPYRLPVGHQPRLKCRGCQGTLCLSHEKSGSGTACVKPAIESGNAALLENSEAMQLMADANRIQSIKIKHEKNIYILNAAVFILGGGALYTPKLLFSSRSSHWPSGIGNHSDQVGRNLMRHYMDLHIVLIKSHGRNEKIHEKEIAFNDFYFHEGEKLGTVQSLGNFPDLKASIAEMKSEALAKKSATSSLLFPLIAAGAAFCIKNIMPKCSGFAAIMEDVPYSNNRVTLTDGINPRVSFEYTISRYEKARIKKFRKLVSNSFSGDLRWLHAQAENNQRLAHACGTCRMGTRAEASVVDAYQKVHGVDNLYIVDSSVFPTGSGINPALTIAALALRAAENLIGKIKE